MDAVIIDSTNKSTWQGIAVYVEHSDGRINPVTFELLGKAKELCSKIKEPLYAVFIGHNIKEIAEEFLYYEVDEVYTYEDEKLKYFKVEPYTAAVEDFINKVRPGVLLAGSTPLGRMLMPRVAARFKTGLSADCTTIDINDNGELLQIRPTYGGDIMAQIITRNKRPQLATVRHDIFNIPFKKEKASGKIIGCPPKNLSSGIDILEVLKKHKEIGITEAEILVAVGRGFRNQRDMRIAEELAEALGAQVGVTRPLVEIGWAHRDKQIGVTGKITKPKLVITLGISGAIQFTIGIKKSEYIIAVNTDENAPIFKLANYGIVGDIYEVVPSLTSLLRGRKEG